MEAVSVFLGISYRNMFPVEYTFFSVFVLVPSKAVASYYAAFIGYYIFIF